MSSYINISDIQPPVDQLNDLDPEINFHFNNFSTNDFCSDNEIGNCISGKHFSVLHSNIRSLSANFDNSTQLLSELQHNFSVIGLTETKIKSSSQILFNNTIEGYSFYSQPTLSNACRGCRFLCFQ